MCAKHFIKSMFSSRSVRSILALVDIDITSTWLEKFIDGDLVNSFLFMGEAVRVSPPWPFFVELRGDGSIMEDGGGLSKSVVMFISSSVTTDNDVT